MAGRPKEGFGSGVRSASVACRRQRQESSERGWMEEGDERRKASFVRVYSKAFNFSMILILACVLFLAGCSNCCRHLLGRALSGRRTLKWRKRWRMR